MSNSLNLRIKDFKPSRHAFKFPNSFELKNVIPDLGIDLDGKIINKIGEDKYGLCGGIVHCAYELFKFKEPVPTMSREPKLKDPLYYYIVDGLVDTFGTRLKDMNRMLDYHKMSDGETKLPGMTWTELFVLKILMTQNRAAQLMLVYHTNGKENAWKNHQVLAYGIEEKDGKGKIFIYDPNCINPGEIDKTYIAYEVKDKRVIMTQPDQMDITATARPVYGFFNVSPPIGNPNHNIAYLASLGAAEMIKRMRNDLRKGILEIAKALKKYLQIADEVMVQLLIAAGYKVYDIMIVMKKHFRMLAKQAFDAFKRGGAKLVDIVYAIFSIYRTGMLTMYNWLKAARVALAQIAKHLRSIYGKTVQDMANFFKRLGFGVIALGKLIRDAFNISAWRELGEILHKAKFAFKDVILFMKKVAIVGARYLADWLRVRFLMGASYIARYLRDVYKELANDILRILHHINIALKIIISIAKSLFNMSRGTVINIVRG